MFRVLGSVRVLVWWAFWFGEGSGLVRGFGPSVTMT